MSAGQVTLSKQATTQLTESTVVTIEIKDFKFNPLEIEVFINDTLVWTQNETILHNVLFETIADAKSPDLNTKGDTWNYTFTETGTFQYRCTYHSSNFDTGMIGVVKVLEAEEDSSSSEISGFGYLEVILGILALVAVFYSVQTKIK